MTMGHFILGCIVFVVLIFAVYLTARLVTMAYFKSRRDYEKELQHGKAQHQRG